MKYDDILKKHQDKPSAFLRNIKKIEGMYNHLAMEDGTVPSNKTINGWFFRAFKEADRDWL